MLIPGDSIVIDTRVLITANDLAPIIVTEAGIVTFTSDVP